MSGSRPLDDVRGFVRAYYGTTLGSSADLATDACCADGPPPAHVVEALARVDDRVVARFYGCGHPIPTALEGCTVLDLGCGTGRDVYVLSQLVGPDGFVHGVDMTAEQLALAEETLDDHMARFGYAKPNVAFHRGYIEDLAALGIADASVDVVVSNCVVNLAPDKRAVLREAARVLKPGGELYFSDVVADRRLPPEVAEDPVLHAECLGGAPYEHDLLDAARAVGFADPRIVKRSPISVNRPDLARRVGTARFESLTLRLFKLPDLEPRCEDHGQVATYRGGMPETPHVVWLDDHHAFEAGRPERVCGNTAAMLSETRFAPWFDVTPRGAHHGLFPCEPTIAAAARAGQAGSPGAACC